MCVSVFYVRVCVSAFGLLKLVLEKIHVCVCVCVCVYLSVCLSTYPGEQKLDDPENQLKKNVYILCYRLSFI